MKKNLNKRFMPLQLKHLKNPSLEIKEDEKYYSKIFFK